MNSKLLGVDPATVTQARAVAAWMAEVNKLVREQGMSLSAAWAQLRETEPEVLDRINEKPENGAALGNSATPQPPALATLLANKPFIAGALHLPGTVEDEILRVAWIGAGSQSVHVDPVKVFMAIQVYFMKKKGLTAPDARIEVCDKFPELALFAKQTPEQPAAAAGDFGIPLS